LPLSCTEVTRLKENEFVATLNDSIRRLYWTMVSIDTAVVSTDTMVQWKSDIAGVVISWQFRDVHRNGS